MKRMRSTGSTSARKTAAIAMAVVAVATLSFRTSAVAAAGALDQIKQTGRIRFGYRTDARPLSFKDEAGKAAGYSVELCQRLADGLKADLGLPALNVEWVPVTIESRFSAVQQGDVDVLCGAASATLARRAEVDFSVPTFPGGIGALVRTDAPMRLKTVLSGESDEARPIWRGTVDGALNAGKFSAVAGTTGEQWLASAAKNFQLTTHLMSVPSYDAGVQGVLDRTTNVFFGDRALLLGALQRSSAPHDLVVLDRLFTYEPVALALPRGDEELRLVVDRALSHLYRSGAAAAVYAKWCGEPDADTLAFFRLSALPD